MYKHSIKTKQKISNALRKFIFVYNELYEKYIINKLSINKIAKLYNCSFETIRDNLHKLKIPVRTKEEGTRMFTTTEEFSKHRSEDQQGKNNNMFGKSNKWGNHSKEAKEKIRITHLGDKNGMFGKSPCWKKIKYNNIWMRSTWEVAYAKYLDKNKIKWLYELKTFDLGEYSYTPDFYLPKTDEYIEIKGYMRKKDLIRMNLFKLENKLVLLRQKELEKMGVL